MMSPLSQEWDYLGILQFLQMTLETMKELFCIAHIRDDEEAVPNMKRKHIGEEEVWHP
jgi:predicted transcriptional regulator